MINLTLIELDNNRVYFESNGHCSHDVCVAVSALCSTFLQFVREMQFEGNAEIIKEAYENGHTETDFYIHDNDTETHAGIKALITGFELFERNYPDEVELNYYDTSK